jgi:HAD superfamily hydrolase (TIGR01549 family)
VLEAVLFDWNNTLVKFTWDEDLLAAGHSAGLGRDDPEFSARYRALVFDRVGQDYAELLRELGVDDSEAFIDAEHAAWQPAHEVLGAAQALLETLRGRGYKTGLVSNAWPEPARLLRADAARYGLAPLFDTMVFSDEVGAMKPEPEIFLRALADLGVEPGEAIYVGDRLESDVKGAAGVGMTTVQALWFEADDTPAGVEPDFLAFTPMDVLNIARRVAR